MLETNPQFAILCFVTLFTMVNPLPVVPIYRRFFLKKEISLRKIKY